MLNSAICIYDFDLGFKVTLPKSLVPALKLTHVTLVFLRVLDPREYAVKWIDSLLSYFSLIVLIIRCVSFALSRCSLSLD